MDVFGGSVKVLLNIPDEWKKLKVYNDLNRDLYVNIQGSSGSKEEARAVEETEGGIPAPRGILPEEKS